VGEAVLQPINEEDLSQESEEMEEEGVSLPLVGQLGAILFVATKPLTTERLAELVKLESDLESVEVALEQLAESFVEESHGFSLKQIAGGWEFRTVPEARTVINRMIPAKAKKLSRAASETLAIVAYKQPVQKADIEAIRGVDATPTIKTLIDAKLIRIIGHDNAPGNPALYGTTTVFLEKFGLSDLGELPSANDITMLMEEPGEAAQA